MELQTAGKAKAAVAVAMEKAAVAVAVKIAPPPQWRVVIYNDDITPMSFVTALLTRVFRMDQAKAKATMLAAHNTGRAVCGTYLKAVAEAKVAQCREAAGERGYPLRVDAEREEAN